MAVTSKVLKEDNRYVIFDNGMLISSVGKKARILKQPLNDDGYPCVSLNGKKTQVHALVANNFLEKIEGLEVDHINGVRSDNRSSNLRWVTHGDNIKNSWRLGLRKSSFVKGGWHPNIKQVLQIKEGKVINEYKSFTEAMEKTGVDRSSIARVCKKVQNKAGGYIWKFK